jgi:thiol-disulfide isomerase/thioredoxin
MKFKLFSLVMLAAVLIGCSANSEAKNWIGLDSATNFPMPLCPDSDRTITETTTDLPALEFACLGHDDYVNLAGLAMDKPLVVSMWASWCVICEDDAPAFIAAKTKFKDINFIGINYQDKENAAVASAAKWKLPFASVVDPAASLQGFYQVVGLPITLIYDKEGKLVSRINGPIGTPEEFTKYLELTLKN